MRYNSEEYGAAQTMKLMSYMRKRIESASFISHIQGDTRQARFWGGELPRPAGRMSTLVCCELSRAKQVAGS